MKCKRAGLEKVFGTLDDEKCKALKGLGIDVDDEKDGADDDAEKALDGALAEIRDHLSKGGKVILDDANAPAVAADATGVLRSFVECAKSLAAGDEAVAKGIVALVDKSKVTDEAIKGLESKIDAALEAIGALAGRPVQAKAARPGTPIATPGTQAAAGDFLDIGVARKSLTAALQAEMAKGPQMDRQRIDRLGETVKSLEGRSLKVTEAMLTGMGVTVLK